MHNRILIMMLLLSNLVFGQQEACYQIIEDGRVGYINAQGEVVIKPIYHEGGEFHEGLASFRLDGRYGFIDTEGKVVLPAKYDYTGHFVHGIVDVYVDGKTIFINREGVPILPDNFAKIQFIETNPNLLVITTTDKKMGVYDLKNHSFIFSPKNYEIGTFSSNRAIVTKKRKKAEQYAVMDLQGNLIVDFGIYEEIESYIDGYANIELDDPANKDGDFDGVIDTSGKLLFKRPYKNGSYVSERFHEGFAVVALYPENLGKEYKYADRYEGYIDVAGNIVFNDSGAKNLMNFSEGRAFGQDKHRDYYVLDTSFKVLNPEQPFSAMKGTGFSGGYAVVKSTNYWGIIDKNMKFVVPPRYDFIYTEIMDSLFFFAVNNEVDYKKYYGVKDLQGNTIVTPIMDDFDVGGFKNGVLKASINGRVTYINRTGDIIWQAEKSTKEESTNRLNITHLNSGYCYAYSKTETAAYQGGGWAMSKNQPKLLNRRSPQQTTLLLEEEDGKLYIKNFSKDTVMFNAQDSRLYLKLQAKNKKGVWQDIEYLPSSWCGNSYHQVALPPQMYWEFERAQYEGIFETELRAELQYTDATTGKKAFMYSNTFKGSVNPGQFWRKPTYFSQGLMDPYAY